MRRAGQVCLRVQTKCKFILTKLQLCTKQTLSSFMDCQTSDFTFPFDWNYTVYTPLKSTYRGTWIKRYIKESTSVSLSGSPLNAWSFLICWDNRERGSSAGSSIVFYLHSLSFIISLGESRIDSHKHTPPLCQAGASAGLWAALLHKSFLLLVVCLQQWSGWTWKKDRSFQLSSMINSTGALFYCSLPCVYKGTKSNCNSQSLGFINRQNKPKILTMMML